MGNIRFKNKKVLFVITTSIIVGVSIFSIIYEPSKNSKELSDNMLVNNVFDQKSDKNTTNNLEQIVLDSLNMQFEEASNKQYSSDPNAVEFSEEDSIKKYTELLSSFESGDYFYVHSQISEILTRYHLTTEVNVRLVNLMNDAILLSNYDWLDWEQKEKSLQLFKNPESFVLGVLKAYPRRREVVIKDINSLSPVSVGVAKIKNIIQLTPDSTEFAEHTLFSSDTRNVYQVNFSFGEFDELYAYVLQNHNRELLLSGIYSEKKYEYLRTVDWWIERGEDREKGS